MPAGFPELDDLYGLATTPPRPVHAPSWPVVAAVGLALTSALSLLGVLLAATPEVGWGLIGYALGALGAPLSLVVHRLLRRQARKQPAYVPRPRHEQVLTAATVVGIALGVLHAWYVATELAKR